MKNEKHRQHFRLSYPYVYRPTLHMDLDEFEVENISRSGLKVLTGSDLHYHLHDTVMCTISFSDGREYGLGGQVARTTDNYVCLQLDTPLPISLMRSEVINVMKNYH